MNITGQYASGSGNNAGLGDDYSYSTASGAFTKVSLGSGKTLNATSGSYDRGAIGFDASRSWTGATSSVGGNGAHNNMPPYLVVYGWTRIS